MAFSTSNLQSAMLAGPIKIMVGDWSGAVGDAPGTISLAGGRVYFHQFRKEDTGSPDEEPNATVTVSGNSITMTVYNHQTINNGRFIIVYS